LNPSETKFLSRRRRVTKESLRSLDPLAKTVLLCLICAGDVDLVDEERVGNDANPVRIGDVF